MRGLILTGALGSGKTTAQLTLVREHGFWTPTTVTTRVVAEHEQFLTRVALEDLISGAVQKKYVLPFRFGQHWYAWPTQDFERLLDNAPGRAVVNVRPYTALLLSAFAFDLIPVWLWTDDQSLRQRLEQRSATRDVDSELSLIRQSQDQEDTRYEAFFLHRLHSDDTVIRSLLRLVGD
jgi:hypothetical protein